VPYSPLTLRRIMEMSKIFSFFFATVWVHTLSTIANGDDSLKAYKWKETRVVYIQR
jgi:hypothetical protein